MSESPNALRRVLVALDASRQSRWTLQIAAGLAARRNAELLALFIEDMNLVHLSGFPFAMEVDRMSAIERQFDAPVMSRSLRTQLNMVRRLLDQIRRDTTLNVSVRTLRGHYLSEAIAAATEMDILFLGRERDTAPGGNVPFGLKRYPATEPPASKPVWVLFDDTPAAVRAVALANELAISEHRQLLVALAGTAAGQIAEMQQRVAEALEAPHAPLQFLTVPLEETDLLLRCMRQKGCLLAVFHRAQAQQLSQTVVVRLIEEIGCPIVLAA